MWGRKKKTEEEAAEKPTALKEAVREARIEAAERSGVVVDLRDAALARLELLNEALDPMFNDVPGYIDLFDRGVSRGDNPRLWIDVIAHVEMGHDRRQYRFVQDTRFGRKVIAESHEIPDIVKAVTHYVARRLVERERALADGSDVVNDRIALHERSRRGWRALRTFILGVIVGIAALFVFAMLTVP